MSSEQCCLIHTATVRLQVEGQRLRSRIVFCWTSGNMESPADSAHQAVGTDAPANGPSERPAAAMATVGTACSSNKGCLCMGYAVPSRCIPSTLCRFCRLPSVTSVPFVCTVAISIALWPSRWPPIAFQTHLESLGHLLTGLQEGARAETDVRPARLMVTSWGSACAGSKA